MDNHIESRVLELGLEKGRKQLEEQWKELRRGWYLGGESFLEKLKGKLDRLVAGKKRESHSGGARRAHGEAGAREQLSLGLKALGLGRADLAYLPKGAPEKTVLAWWLRVNLIKIQSSKPPTGN